MATDNLTTERPTSSTDWAEAVHNYERAQAEREKAGEAHNAAEKAYLAETRCGVDYHDEYGINYSSGTKEEVLADLRYYPARAAAKAASEGKKLSDEQIGELYRDIPCIADDFLAHQQFRAEANERHRVTELDDAYTLASSAFWEARRTLLATPAPDAEAMLFKLDLLAADMREALQDDADSIEAIRDDAKRLLGRA